LQAELEAELDVSDVFLGLCGELAVETLALKSIWRQELLPPVY